LNATKGVQAIAPDLPLGDDLYAQRVWGMLPTGSSVPNWSP
jgi:hypothetical protein